MERRLRRWGNSLAIRIPSDIVRATHIGDGTPVDVELDGDRIILRLRHPSLAELVDRITPENRHGEEDWGPAKGREAW